MKYYYLVTSLPAVELTEAPQLAMAAFLAACALHLPPAERDEVSALAQGDWSGARSPAALAWIDAETQIRNAVARARAAKTGVDPAPHQRPQREVRLWLEAAVETALSRPGPLERELALDQLRFAVLEEIARSEPFGLPALLAYGVKLRLALRWSSLDEETGRRRAEALLATAG
jgi:hypothetical protein